MSIKNKINTTRFLSEYWQKKWLLIEDVYNTDFPLSIDEIAGLACEEEVDSRLIYNHDNKGYSLLEGPFSEAQLTQLDTTNWMLLIQAFDHWHDAVFQYFRDVDFIPYWRTDDIMVSISAPGGTAGPHFDYYDVFLIQIQGSKTWKIGQRTTTETSVDNTSGLRLLPDFREEQCLSVKPGDVLYIPPKVAHWGTADELSITLSIGFRAPSHSEIIDDFSAEICQGLREDERFRDISPDYDSPGEIPDSTILQLRSIIAQRMLSDDDALKQWFGKYMTLPRAEYKLNDTEEPITLTDQDISLVRAPGARLAYSAASADSYYFFINGECLSIHEKEITLIQYLCNHLKYDKNHITELTGSTEAYLIINKLLEDKVILSGS